MPQAINLSLNNGAATPVAKNFELIAPAASEQPALWFLREGANTSSFPKIEFSARKVKSAKPGRTAELRITIPATANNPQTGQMAVYAKYLAKVIVQIDDDFPEANRNDANAFLRNAVSNALIQACLRDAFPAT